MERWAETKTGRARSAGRVAALSALLLTTWGVVPARALPPTDDTEDPPPAVDCVGETTGSLSLPTTASHGQWVTASWSVQVPAGCTGVTQTINGVPVARTGSMSVQPMAPGQSYALQIRMADARRTLATASVKVNIPPGAVINITGNHMVPLLIEALKTEDATIHVADNVELDLSGREHIAIAPGVRLLGGRQPNVPGGRIYTRTFPFRFLEITGDKVRISGLRIDGGEMNVAGSVTITGDSIERSIGISVYAAVEVEIDNNELYGWRGSAVSVYDDDANGNNRIKLLVNPMTVRIHDNYIHHNQAARGNGYGVETEKGAYALIEKNVFDYNRHAISSDGRVADDRRAGSGYFAYRNLVLKNGGVHTTVLGVDINTHMFDVHGREECGKPYYCGDAGEYYDIGYNSMLYDAGAAFKLRGTPIIAAHVAHNVFSHDSIDDAVKQTESGLDEWDNRAGVDESDNLGSCDFDGDGVADKLFATGATWWYSSAGTSHWVYLNTSTLRVGQVTLGDVNGDGKCDVSAEGKVSSGGTGPLTALTGGMLLQNTNGQVAEWSIEGGKIASQTFPALVDSTLQLRGTGDFDGDGRHDYLWQRKTGEVAIWNMSSGTRVGEGFAGPVPAGWTYQGIGDFDGDRQSDILWRDDAGQLAIWFKGDPADRISPAAYPGYENVPAPVDLRWQVKGIGDFDGDGRSDVLWRDGSGQVAIWHMTGATRSGEAYPGGQDPQGLWTIQGLGDFDADGRSDILWRDAYGKLAIWFAGDATRTAHPSYQNAGRPMPLSTGVNGISDYNADGYADILWWNADGQVAIWLLEGGRFVSVVYPGKLDGSWQIKGMFADAR